MFIFLFFNLNCRLPGNHVIFCFVFNSELKSVFHRNNNLFCFRTCGFPSVNSRLLNKMATPVVTRPNSPSWVPKKPLPVPPLRAVAPAFQTSVLFVGSTGAGKSTLCNFLHDLGKNHLFETAKSGEKHSITQLSDSMSQKTVYKTH